jgi:glutaredoxin
MDIELNGNVIIRHQSVPDCEWCDKSKEFLDEKGIKYTIINSDKKLFGK